MYRLWWKLYKTVSYQHRMFLIYIHIHTRYVPNCLFQCNTIDCKIYAHWYSLPYSYKILIFMLSRTRKPEKTPWGKNSGTCSPNHAAAINFWSLEACKWLVYITTTVVSVHFPQSIIPRKTTKLEVLVVGTGVEWLHHVLYLLLYQTTVPSCTAPSLWCPRAAKIYISVYFMLFIRQKMNNFVFTLTQKEKHTRFQVIPVYLGCSPVPYSDK